MANPSTTGAFPWFGSIRGIVPRKVSDYVDYIHSTLQSFKTQQQALNVQLTSGSVGVGNGSAGNVQAPATGSGKGPAAPQSIVGWKQVTDSDGNTYYVPLFQ